MIGEIEFLRAELTAKSKVIENLILSQSMLRDELLCSYKSGSGKISAEGIYATINLLIIAINL